MSTETPQGNNGLKLGEIPHKLEDLDSVTARLVSKVNTLEEEAAPVCRKISKNPSDNPEDKSPPYTEVGERLEDCICVLKALAERVEFITYNMETK